MSTAGPVKWICVVKRGEATSASAYECECVQCWRWNEHDAIFFNQAAYDCFRYSNCHLKPGGRGEWDVAVRPLAADELVCLLDAQRDVIVCDQLIAFHKKKRTRKCHEDNCNTVGTGPAPGWTCASLSCKEAVPKEIEVMDLRDGDDQDCYKLYNCQWVCL